MTQDRELRVVTPPDGLILSVESVRDDHLRAANGDDEDSYVEALIKVGTRMAERETQRSIPVQTLALHLPGFPTIDGDIALPRPPVIEIVSIVYIDSAGDTQTLDADNYVLRVTGKDFNTEGVVTLAYGVSWPSALTHMGGVIVTYRAGFVGVGSPEVQEIPEDILHGVRLVAGELYKQRTLSVHAPNQNPSVIAAHALWAGWKVY